MGGAPERARLRFGIVSDPSSDRDNARVWQENPPASYKLAGHALFHGMEFVDRPETEP